MKTSTALFLGGYLWTGVAVVKATTTLPNTEHPGRQLLAMLLTLVVTASAADTLISERSSPHTWVIVGYAMTPPTVALLATQRAPWSEDAWWSGACLPIIATIAARWGLPLALASSGGQAIVALVTAAPGHQLGDAVYAGHALSPLILWPCAAVVFRRMLRSQNEQVAVLQQSATASQQRRDLQSAGLDDLPARLFATVGPTLRRIAAGEPGSQQLRQECRALDRLVRDQIRTRRMLDDDGRATLNSLALAGWRSSFEDEGPPFLAETELVVVRRVCASVLAACLPSAPGTVTVRLLGQAGRLLTIVVAGPCAAGVAQRLITEAPNVSLDLSPEDLLAEIPLSAAEVLE